MKRNTILITIAALLVSGIIFGNRQAFTSAPQKEKVNNAVLSNNDTLHSSKHRTAAQDTTRTDTIDVRGEGDEPSVNLPDMPETEGFAPTMMSDIEPANPASKINIIAPPTANNHGTASLSYAFEMPPARNGMAPQLGLQYSSDGGSGFCGEGWDLPIPSITVDTRWGVPRYDANNETETYLLNGVMLCFETGDSLTTAHRTQNVSRTQDRRFYTRRGGDFSRIVRKGNSPSNYYWEVTDNNGTVYTYGSSNGTDGMLKGSFTDAAGNSRTVIAEWKLTKVQEIHGDYCVYSYTNVDETISGSLKAKAIYLNKVSVYNEELNDALTEVIVSSGGTKNEMKTNARYGFLTSSKRLLTNVTVKFLGESLRQYQLTYTNGAFNKKLLSKVTHKDNHGQEVSFNQFTYHNNVSGNAIPFTTKSKTLQGIPDDANFPVSANGLSGKATALGGSKTKGEGGGMYSGIGDYANDGSVKESSGISVSYGQSVTEGLSTLADINGDGLPDRLFVKNKELYVSLQNTNGSFNSSQKIVIPISGFQKTTTSTYGGGSRAYKLPMQAGIDNSLSKSKTTTYLADVNGDGLVDIVSGETVYFNTTKPGDAVPSFSTDSDATGVPYDGGGTVQFSNTYDAQERDSLLKYSPMVDAVRVWTAPIGGNISISGSVRRLLPTVEEASSAEYKDADVMKTSIQYQNVIKWSKIIQKGDGASYSANSSFHVSAGEKVFFRVQSGTNQLSNGSFDKVVWEPEIRYTGYDFQAVDTLNYSPADYQNAVYKTSQAVSWSQDTPVPVSGTTATIHGSISQTVALSEAVKLRVVRLNSYGQQTSHTDFGVTSVINQTVSLNGASFIRLEFFSEGNVQWEKLRPRLQITCAGNTFNAPVKYLCYNRQYKAGGCYKREHALLFPKIHFSSQIESDSVHMVVKTFSNLLVHASTYAIQNTDYFNQDNTYYVPISGDSVIVEYYFKNPTTAGKVQHALFYMADNASDVPTSWNEMMSDDSLSVMQTGDEADRTSHTDDSFNSAGDANMRTGNWYASVYSRVEPTAICPDYRGWSLISYIPDAAGYNGPINLSRLVPPTAQSNVMFHPLCIMRQDSVTVPAFGHSRNVWVHGDTLCAGRLSVPEVRAVNPLASLNGSHSEAFGIPLVTKNSSTDIMGGAGAAFFSMSGNVATGNSKTTTAFMDMNGDSYPDILGDGNIRYTDALGRFGTCIGNMPKDKIQSAASQSLANTYGGHAVHAFKRKGHPENGSERTAQIAGNLRLSGGSSDEDTEWEYIDLNGDGLPDLFDYQLGKVRFNLGYSFTPSTSVNGMATPRMHGYDVSFNIGGSFDHGLSSFSGGTAGAKTTNYSKCEYIDMNADGLPEKVVFDTITNTTKAYLNMGAGFSSTAINLGSLLFQKSETQSESANMAFTLSIPITEPTKRVVVNPSTHTSWSMNTTNATIRDIDGDGYADILTSSSPNTLSIKRSDIGCTNMLLAVTNSLGGRFIIEYNRSTATFDHPGVKYVMSAVTIDDGIHDDGPNQRQTFTYADGKYDRREREFLGFGTVTTNDINTAVSNTSIYRKNVEEYDVSNWYTQGNLLSSSIQKNSTVKSKETYEYYSYKAMPATGNSNSSNTGINLTTGATTNGAMFTPLKYMSTALGTTVMTEQYYAYKLNGSHGEVDMMKYSDKGTLTEDGTGTCNRKTAYTYAYTDSNDIKHVYGLPTKIVVKANDNTVYHETAYTYHDTYPTQVTQVTRKVGSADAVTNYTYESHGNVTIKRMPIAGDAKREVFYYSYDDALNTYISEIRDTFGYFTHYTDYSYAYGIAQCKYDKNLSYFHTINDEIGRYISITSPNENALNGVQPVTIRYSYSPMATVTGTTISTPASSMTTYYFRRSYYSGNNLVTDTDSMKIAVFVDGFGRVIQTRKEGYVMNNNTKESATIVSGKVNYDALGRPVQEYQPVISSSSVGVFSMAETDSVPPIINAYDELDRRTSVTQPDSARTTFTYSVNNHQLVTRQKNAIDNIFDTYTNGSGLTVKQVRHKGGNSYNTLYTYDGIDRLLTVKDALNSTTTYNYDMADNILSVRHPASGLTSYTYDLAGNMITQKNADGKTITYTYDCGRLIQENVQAEQGSKVKYYYGINDETHHAEGRTILRIDGSGATEYWYDALGNVSKTLRTIVVPYTGVATFETTFEYDSYGKLLNITYPDGELVSYWYDHCGNLEKVRRGNNKTGFQYVKDIGYDKYGHRVYMSQGNGVKIYSSYDPLRLWLSGKRVINALGGTSMNSSYEYDAVGNITKLRDTGMTQEYEYNELSVLTDASLSLFNAGVSCDYTFSMTHDQQYRIRSKSFDCYSRTVNGSRYTGYDMSFTYSTNSSKKYQLTKIAEETWHRHNAEGKVRENHSTTYDKNGNLKRVLSENNESRYRWNTHNHMLAASSNGYVSTYIYDADGQRAVKQSAGSESVYTNGLESGQMCDPMHYSLYVNPYFMMYDDDHVNKHIYIDNERVAVKKFLLSSVLGGYTVENLQSAAGYNIADINYDSIRGVQESIIADSYTEFDLPFPETNRGNNQYFAFIPSSGRFIAPSDTIAEEPTDEERLIPNPVSFTHYYVSDHIGSTRLVSNEQGRIVQSLLYTPTGELLLDRQYIDGYHGDFQFSGKEVDEETGLSYFGARYLDSHKNIWLSPDPLQLKYPHVSSYAYCMGNPVNRIDPEGKDGVLVFDHENNVIVVKANYYVQTVGRPSIYGNNLGYTPSDIKYLNNQINGYLNNLNLKVEDGVYCNYSIKFELSFISGGNQIDVANKASEDFYEGVHIGNTFSKWDTTYKLFIPSSENGVDNVVGGVTNHKNEIIMNYLYDGKMNRVHEVFHTLGFDDFSHGEKNHGIMSYPPRKPDQSDVNRLVYGGFLPMLHK